MTTNEYSIWDRDTQERIHHETLKVLKNVGIRVDHHPSLEIFHSAGAHIEKHEIVGIVRFPEHLVIDCIAWAPKSVTYYGRDPDKDFDTKSGKVGFSTFGECVKIIDPYTRQIRPTTKADCANTGRMVDYFDELCVMERAVCSADRPFQTQPLHNLEVLLNNTTKHIIVGAGDGENSKIMLEMARAAAGSRERFSHRPIISFAVCPTSPLTLAQHTCEVIGRAAEAGVGMWLIAMVLAGGTGPATLAGTVVQHNAEILAALCLAQLVRKGTPCTYCSSTSIMDLKSGASVIGAPEYGLLGRATARMADYYRLPCAIATGVTESKSTDIQAAYETAMNLTQVALTRPPIVYGIGSIESGLTFDLAKMVLDCELIRYLLTAMEGIQVNGYELAYEQIRKVGPGGTYLMEDHTFDNMRRQSKVMVFDRNPREAWEVLGAPKALDRAYAKAIEIIENHIPKPLEPGVKEEITSLIHDYEMGLQ